MRTSGGVSNSWTAPALPTASDIFAAADDVIDATITAEPDDDTTASPGDVIPAGETGNREDAPGTQVAQAVQVVRKYTFDKDTGMQWFHIDANAQTGQPESGTMPWENAKVSPGQVVTFNVGVTDSDGVTATGLARQTFNPEKQGGFGGKYVAELTVTNASFAGNTNQKSVDLVWYGQYLFGSTKMTIDANWTGAQPVTVAITVKDQKVVPANFKLNTGASRTDIQDTDIQKTLSWTKTTGCPTTMTGGILTGGGTWDPTKQLHMQANGQWTYSAIHSEQNTHNFLLFYKFGPNAAPAYEGITITETFDAYTTNIEKAWIKQAILNQYPANATAAQILNGEAPANYNATFTINSQNAISDYYQLTIAQTMLVNLCATANGNLPAASKNKWIHVSKKQHYNCGGGANLYTNTLVSKILWNETTIGKRGQIAH